MSTDCFFKLDAPYQPCGDQPKAIDQLAQGLADGLSYQTVLGVTGSGKTFTMASLIERVQRPALILAPNKTLAAQLYAEMASFFPKHAVEYFVSYYDYYQPEAYVPTTDTFIEKDASINEHVEQMRLSATKAILERPDTIIVATVSAIYGLGDPQAYLKMIQHLRVGHRLEQRELLRRLATMQYQRNDMELKRGTFRVRGDVVDIFPAESHRDAVRVILFDDEIEQLQLIDPLTGRAQSDVVRYTVYPKTHYVTPREVLAKSMEHIKTELRERLAVLRDEGRLLEAQRLEQRTQYDLEMINELGYCSGIENYSRYLSGRAPGEPPPTLLDYLPEHAMVMIDESHVTLPQLSAMYRGDRSRKETLVHYGFRLPSAMDNRPLRFDEFEALVPQMIFVSATPSQYELEHSQDAVVELVVRPTGLLDPVIEVRPVHTQVDDCLSEIRLRMARNERVLITTLTKKMSEDLTDYLEKQGIRVNYLHSDIGTVERSEIIRSLRHGQIDVLVGINLLREGLDMPEVSLVAIFDADKEGFLRSERSLIQTIGRAARNAAGRAILYADRVTPSMQKAMEETERRRRIQQQYNEAHGIVPQTIVRAIHDAMDQGAKPSTKRQAAKAPQAPSASLTLDAKTAAMSPEQLAKHIAQLEKRMLEHAHHLEFEAAAALRDEMEALQNQLFLG